MNLAWTRFLTAVLPELTQLARTLYRVFDGDRERAKAEIRRIRDHGERLAAAHREFNQRVEALEKKP